MPQCPVTNAWITWIFTQDRMYLCSGKHKLKARRFLSGNTRSLSFSHCDKTFVLDSDGVSALSLPAAIVRR